MYEIVLANSFKKDAKSISKKDLEATIQILDKLANGEVLEKKYKDHKLKGVFKGFRECHIKPDLLLIYKKLDDLLILNAVRLGSHSELF